MAWRFGVWVSMFTRKVKGNVTILVVWFFNVTLVRCVAPGTLVRCVAPGTLILFSFSSLPPSLGLAYAGSAREDVIQLLIPVLWDSSSLEVSCYGDDLLAPFPDLIFSLPSPWSGGVSGSSLVWNGGCGQLP